MKNMNIYLLIIFWVVGIMVALIFFCYAISGFNSEVLILLPLLWGIPGLPFLLFISTSFIFGLKGTEHLY